MSWILRKLDNLGAAVVGGGLAAACSQAPAIANAYLQRLGGRVDEARDTLARLQSGEMIPGASAAVKSDVVTEQTRHLAGLDAQYQALRDAAPAFRPLRILLDLDPKVLGRATADFTPALPLDTGGLLWVVTGLVLGLLLWELIKAPGKLVWLLSGAPARPEASRLGHLSPDAAPPRRKEPPRRREPHL